MMTANVSDNDPEIVRSICPNGGMVFADRLYDTSDVKDVLRSRGCASGIIQKNNRKAKNFDLDRWRSTLRMPYESTFSCLSKFARYRGRLKMLFQGFVEAFAFNLKLMSKLCPVV
jgi:IS5 family transposase